MTDLGLTPLQPMEPYLKRLAQLFVQQQAAELSRTIFVFPNRRAGLFFRKYLGQAAGKPILAPETITINQCFERLSDGLQPADRLGLLFKLFRIYRTETGTDEPFDKFVFWGEMLLSDFNELDKYLIPADRLFANLHDLKQLETGFDYLTDEQKEAIERFWNGFDADEKRENRRQFLRVWQHLYPVYQAMQQEMLAEGRAYEGCLQRRVAERAQQSQMGEAASDKQFVFIGFNALTPCEEVLMAGLQRDGRADFYWDDEAPETNDPQNLASHFVSKNRRQFPSRMTLPPEPDYGTPHGRHADIHLLPMPSAIGQTTCIYNLLHLLHPAGQPADWTRTAIVLPDENLLMPMLHAIPEHIGQVNVTMGYPLKNTAVFALLEHAYELQRTIRIGQNGKVRFYHKCTMKILRHPYVQSLCPTQAEQLVQAINNENLIYIPQERLTGHDFLNAVFVPVQTTEQAIPYVQNILDILLQKPDAHPNERNYMQQYYATVNRTRDILEQQGLPSNISVQALFMLLHELAAGVNIPFTGEPLNGLQIMGTLETRGLDFDNLIIASMNEGVFPKTSQGNSFIPYELRRGFGLPTADRQNAMFAYNFYRLIYRARNIYFLYDTRNDGPTGNEPSRFIRQLQYQYDSRLKLVDSRLKLDTQGPRDIQIRKTPDVMALLEPFAAQESPKRYLSASALNSYLNCPLQFYLQYIIRMKETPQVNETIESDMFGTLLHAIMESLYKPHEGKVVDQGTIARMLADKEGMERIICEVYNREYLKNAGGEPIRPEGRDKLVTDVIKKCVGLLLRHDQTLAPFTYLQSEVYCTGTIPLFDGRQINVMGYIDRVDCKDGHLRIVDYKTGNGDLEFTDVAALFDPTNAKRAKYALQTFLYARLYCRQWHPQQPVETHIYYVRGLSKPGSPTQVSQKVGKVCMPVDNFEAYAEEFERHLTILTDEIFNPDVPFEQNKDERHCEYCDFKAICNR